MYMCGEQKLNVIIVVFSIRFWNMINNPVVSTEFSPAPTNPPKRIAKSFHANTHKALLASLFAYFLATSPYIVRNGIFRYKFKLFIFSCIAKNSRSSRKIVLFLFCSTEKALRMCVCVFWFDCVKTLCIHN